MLRTITRDRKHRELDARKPGKQTPVPANPCLASAVGLLAGLLLAGAVGATIPIAPARAGQEPSPLPRFTEEREAAALFFVKKHLPELLSLLEELKKNSPGRYEREVREIFRETELLADLRDEPRRHDLELKIWKTENRAYTLLARLVLVTDDERKKLETQLLTLSRELVDLDIQVLKLKAEQLEKDLTAINEELSRVRDNADKLAKERFESLLAKVKKGKK